MSFRHVFGVVGLLLVFVALAMLVAAGVAILYRDGDTLGILGAAVVTFAVGSITYRLAEAVPTVVEGS